MMHLLRNSPRVLANMGSSILHQPGFFRDQSLILASFALVVSRILVANVSALKAQGTPEGPFRYRESIRTNLREVGGFLTGFGLLRAFQHFSQKGLASLLGVEHAPINDGYSFKNAWQDLTSRSKPAVFDPNLAYGREPAIAGDVLKPTAKMISGLFDLPMLSWMKKSAAAGVKTIGLSESAAALARNKAFLVKGVYKLAPIVISSVPSVALAGYWLERITRDHSERIVDVVSDCLDGKLDGNSEQKNTAKTAVTPPAVSIGRLTAPAVSSMSQSLPSVAAGPAGGLGMVQFGVRPVSPYGAFPTLSPFGRV